MAGAGPGDVLVLPLSPFRAPAWNRGRTVLDPLGRYLGRDHVAGDELVVSGVVVAGEDPRAARAAEALSEPDPRSRAEALAGLGIGVVVRDRTAPGGRDEESVEVAGRRSLDTGDLVVTELEVTDLRRAPTRWVAAMAVAWVAWLLLVGAAAGRAGGRLRAAYHR